MTHDRHPEPTSLATEERYRLLVENSGDVVFQSVAGVLEWVSPSVTTVLGWSPEDLIGRTSDHLWHADDVLAPDELREHTLHHEPGRGVFRLQRKDGTYAWVEVTMRQYLSEDGRMGATGSLRDVGRQLEADRDRRHLADTLQGILDSLPDVHVLLVPVRDEDGTIVDFLFERANPAACAFEGMDHRELVGSSLLTLHPHAVEDGYFRRLVSVLETGRPLVLDDADYPLERAGGDTRWFDLSATKVGDAVSQVVRDVTERHLSAELLARSQEEYRLLAENASDVVFRIDADGLTGWLSESVRDLLAWEPDELVGLPFRGFLHPDDREALGAVLAGTLPGVPATFNARVLTKSGDWHWVSVLLRSIRHAGGPPSYVGSWRDIEPAMTGLQDTGRVRDRHLLVQQVMGDVVALEVDGVLDWVSTSSERLLGRTPVELVGVDLVHLCDARDLARLHALRDAVAADGEGAVVVRLRDTDDVPTWVEISARLWVTGDDRDAVALRIRDYREQHYAARALARALGTE